MIAFFERSPGNKYLLRDQLACRLSLDSAVDCWALGRPNDPQ